MYIPVQCYGLHTIPLMCYTPCCNLSSSILFGILCIYIYICVLYTTMCCMLKFYVFLCTLSEMTNKTCAIINHYQKEYCWILRHACFLSSVISGNLFVDWPVTYPRKCHIHSAFILITGQYYFDFSKQRSNTRQRKFRRYSTGGERQVNDICDDRHQFRQKLSSKGHSGW